ncbi:MAG: glycerophosphodiester phosphodiesterase, partial [Lentisphaerae bacterium]|nr:glycerophosphodiester phosphodiesterase [Lentisphaerota bacterium]
MAEEKWQIHAHRGGRSEFDENTLSAFQASYAAGLRGFETDVRMCKDGALVIMHDAS